jgi:hypothetical protein
MLGATIALAVLVLGAAPSADPSTLVLQLGSPQYATRESAQADLARLGRLALPALRAAKDSKDLEIRLRVTALLARIEASLLVEPTLVALDFRDVPIGQVLRTIDEQTGLNVFLDPGHNAAAETRRVTLQSAEPVPFWKAIDALCKAGQLHYLPGVDSILDQRDGAFPLYDGIAPRSERSSDSGPFRVQLTNVYYQSEVDLTQRRTGPAIRAISPQNLGRSQPIPSKQFYVQLMALAEPHLSITRQGAIKLSTAVDDQGQSLLPRQDRGMFQHSSGYFGMNPSPLVRLRIDLAYPEKAGSQIRLIRGVIPVVVATHKPDPLEIVLSESVGKSFQNEEININVRDSRPALRNQPATVELSIRPMGRGPAPVDLGDGEPLGYRPDSHQQQIEVLDAQGRVLTWFPSVTGYNGEETRLTLTMIARGVPPIPAKIRYHGMIRAASEIPFEFRNIPMP